MSRTVHLAVYDTLADWETGHVTAHLNSGAWAADPDRFPDAGEPWQVLKVYYQHGFNRPRMVALHEAMIAEGLESPFTERMKEWKPDPAHDARITTRIPCADYFPVRDRALIAHATQIDPDGPWFHVPLEVHMAAWPTEDYELARSFVDSELPEDDLFAGIRGRDDVDT